MKTGLHSRENIIEKIVNELSVISLINSNAIELHLLVSRTNQDEVQFVLDDPDFAPELERQLLNHGIKCNTVVFKWKFLTEGIVPPKLAKDLKSGYWLEIISGKAPVPEEKFAEVEILYGKGRKTVYKLEVTPDSKYNIGQGTRVQLGDGMRHMNDIVFERVAENVIHTAPNRYVSRFHAVILFSKAENRLCLKTVKSNATRIFRVRNGQQHTIDVNNGLLEYPLEHEDQIQLGGMAGCMMQFRFIPDSLLEQY